MSALGIKRIVVSVADLDRALELYRDVLGLKENQRVGETARLGLPGGDGELFLHQRTPTPGLAGVSVIFTVDDVDADTEAAVRVGATVLDEPVNQPWGERMSVFTDADGHVVCLSGPIRD